MSDLEFSPTPTALLRKNLQEKAFNSAQKTRSATLFARGELDKERYIRLLMLLWHVYDEMQRAVAQHSLDTMRQACSACMISIARDISYLLQIPQHSWQAHPKHATFISSMPQALTAYLSRLQALASGDQPALLLVHAFVRHLGDARCGLLLHDKLQGIYGPKGQGISFLDFQATKSEFMQLGRWYENELDFMVSDDLEMKGSMIQEGIRAFELNCALFAALDDDRESGMKSPSDSLQHSLPALGNPLSESGTDDSWMSASPTQERGPEGRAGVISMSSFVALAVAICIAQPLIVFGGLTGSRGYDKMQAFLRWVRIIWESFART